MSKISRRALFALPVVPFTLGDPQPRSAPEQITITGRHRLDKETIDSIIAGIREAANDRDVIIFGPGSRQARELVDG